MIYSLFRAGYFWARVSILACSLLVLNSSFTHAQTATWPDKPIKIMVPYGAGGNVDLVARVLAQRLNQRLGVSVFVDNQAGANGNIGVSNLARAEPDGSTVAILTSATMAINPFIYKHNPVNMQTGLTLISEIATGPMAIIAHPSLKINSMQELIQYAREHPGILNCASGSNGSLAHLTLELLKLKAGIDIVHVPYKSGAAALSALLAGQVELAVNTFSTTVPFALNGQLRALALTSEKRSDLLPQIPTVAESTIEGFTAESWLALVGPPNMSEKIVKRIQRELKLVLAEPDIEAKLLELGSEPVGSDQAKLQALVKNDSEKWSAVVTAAKMKAE